MNERKHGARKTLADNGRHKKRNFKDIGRDIVDCISLTQENGLRQAFMNTVVKNSYSVKR
jgi:hypothetical protein